MFRTPEAAPVHHFGFQEVCVEPLLILGSSILWLAVLPVAGVFWSGVALWKLIGIQA